MSPPTTLISTVLRRTLQRPVRYSTYFIILGEAKDSNKFSVNPVSLYF